MARYADTLLADGERIVLRTRQHWFATIVEGRRQWLLLAASLLLLVLSLNLDGTVRDVVGWVVLAGLVLSVGMLVVHYWSWFAQDYLVTNRRVLKVEGILNKRSADSSLEKVNDAVLEQNLFGRLFGYGDLNILTAADVDLDEFRMLNAAPKFKREMLNQKHELEMEIGRAPSAPFRATPPAAGMIPVGQEPARPPSIPTPVARTPEPEPSRSVMTSVEITDALGRLATLRDRGAITRQEFETKKADLLSRL